MKKIIVSDLDGSLLKTDMLYESFISDLSHNPLILLFCIYWLIIGGKTLLKSKLAHKLVDNPKYKFEPQILPYNQEVLDYLKAEKDKGAKIVLATATHQLIAQKIADELKIFDEVLATTDQNNLKGLNKATLLNERYGKNNYLYIGNAREDLEIWKNAKGAICVDLSLGIIKQIEQSNIPIEQKFSTKKLSFKSLFRLLRVHQWVKNLLLFVPLVTASLMNDLGAWLSLIAAFFSFSFMASFVYILNDLLDLDSDRKHLIKRNRPLASGTVSIPIGLFFLPLLFIVSVLLAFTQLDRFVWCLLIYFVVTTLYSFILKRIVIVDCLTLAFLYTFRMLTGIVVLSVPISLWLVSFSGFFFLSLAFVKRIAELKNLEKQGKEKNSKRGYLVKDLPMLSQLGVASGYTSTLIFALYVNSGRISLFNHPTFVYFCGPVLVYWISYVFFKTNRGEMDEDPVIFAFKNKHSLFSGLLFCGLFILGVL